ncbi:MAG: COG1361 S-layer family protein [Candidatus Nanohalobium sp.]
MNTKTLVLITAALLLTGAATSQTTKPTTNIDPVLINTDPAPVQSGEDAEITFKLRNTGNTEAEDVKVRIVDSFPFKLKPDRRRNYSLGDIMPGQEYQISTDVLVAEDAPDGQNSLKLEIHQGDISYTEEVPVQVQSQDIELNLANLQTSPSHLTPDTEDAKLTLEVVNNGEKTAENVVVNIELPEGFQETSSFSTRQALGNIGPGEVKKASFNFDIGKSAETGTVTIPTDITYSTDGDDATSRITEEADFSFNLAGKPQFKVVKVESNLAAGEQGQLTIKVRNTGSEKASATRIRVLDSSDMPFSYTSSSQYIGTLEPNQTGTAVFQVDTEKGAVIKDYLIDFKIRGVKDTQTYVEEATVEAAVQPGETGGTNPLPLVAVVLIATGGLYYFRDTVRELLNR